MPKNNIYLPKENLAKTEIVQELKEKYEVPSFEEFMKTYEDGNLNYDDLNSDSVGGVKGYGPCPNYCYQRVRNGTVENVYSQTPETTIVYSDGTSITCCCTNLSRFSLDIKCYNWCGDGAERHACSTSRALRYAHNLEDDNWPHADVISDSVLRKCATLIREAVRKYDRGQRINGYVKVEGRFWGSCDWSYSY